LTSWATISFSSPPINMFMKVAIVVYCEHGNEYYIYVTTWSLVYFFEHYKKAVRCSETSKPVYKSLHPRNQPATTSNTTSQSFLEFRGTSKKWGIDWIQVAPVRRYCEHGNKYWYFIKCWNSLASWATISLSTMNLLCGGSKY
jgi:hypothetical protein